MNSVSRNAWLINLLLSLATCTPFSSESFQMRSITSSLDPKVSISYMETHICETTPGVKSYSGYVNIPANDTEGRSWDTHTFFWFFESRHDPSNSPLSLWIQGGPGAPSIPSAMGENGPCRVTADSKDTVLNEWSWNNNANLLYFDQPVQVGFSYDTLINGTIEEVTSPFIVTPRDVPLDQLELNNTFLGGTFSSQSNVTTNTTATAANSAWHFMQIWTQEFPEYKPSENKFSIWSESYGGHYAPTFSDFFEKQNKLIADGVLEDDAIPLHLDTVGLINPCIDALTQIPYYPMMAYNNTYGLQIINETQYQDAIDSFPVCRELIETCLSLAEENDPLNTGHHVDTNKACANAVKVCFGTQANPYYMSGHNNFDISASTISSFPPKYAEGYLNTQEIQQELGVPLNFTGYSAMTNAAFTQTGDFVRGRNLAILGELLDRGVKVALVYGDRDFQCNWLGGEQISLAINSTITSDFHNAGYAEIAINDSYVGGMVRQYGNLSFARVFQAGHEVPWYQPETAYRIFQRVMSNKDVATGTVSTAGCNTPYSSEGRDEVFTIRHDPPAPRAAECYFWDVLETCTQEQGWIMWNDTAIMKDFVMIGYKSANGSNIYY